MSYNGLPFVANYPDAIVVPAHPSNLMRDRVTGAIKPINRPRALVIHTPEEPSDDFESTPRYFATANRNASTHYYADSDGDIYQMVPEDYGAVANGLRGKPAPAWSDGTSLNYQTLSIEVEGYAAAMHRTCPPGSRQWNSVRTWIVSRALIYRISIRRERVIGHYEVADNHTDPGTLKLDRLVADAAQVAGQLIAAVREAQAHEAIREALTKAWDEGDWRMMHAQLHYIGVP